MRQAKLPLLYQRRQCFSEQQSNANNIDDDDDNDEVSVDIKYSWNEQETCILVFLDSETGPQ